MKGKMIIWLLQDLYLHVECWSWLKLLAPLLAGDNAD